ncbi:MAG: hypothetical protein KAJ79_04940 [Candidatus Omnitrophica bacterium]|nr:hypothetical protein [Candidatus Omnitrophota bacterium]MCK5288388.1 hypothetical protein [Candidatus Omnitrophota bacterium]
MLSNEKTKFSFTIIETIIVVIIVGILVSFAMPAYINAKRNTLDKEAQTQLRLIRSAERVYRLEVGGYVNCADNATCNNRLNLDLPLAGVSNWDYSVINSSEIVFDGQAQNGGGTSDWQIDEDGVLTAF